MRLHRRAMLAASPSLFVSPVLADESADFFSQHERATGGRIGLYASNLATGHTLASRADERFLMCSTFKVSLVACTLARVDQGQDRLERFISYSASDLLSYAPISRQNLTKGGMTLGAICQAAIELSDNTCANLLLDAIGGPVMLTRFWRTTGDAITRLDHHEPQLNRSSPDDTEDTTTPAAMAGNLRRLLLGDVLSPESRAHLTRWMLNCQTGATLLRAGLPSDWKVADKTGNNGRDALADIAVAWPAPGRPVIICAYTQGGVPKPEQLRIALARIGQLVGKQLD